MKRVLLRVIVPYVVFAGLWILLSDELLGAVVHDPTLMTRVSIFKGWGFVVVTALLLYSLLRVEFRARERIGAALHASERRLASIVEAVPEGIMIVDAHGRITFANPTAENLLGLNRSTLLTRTHNDPAWNITTVEGRPFPDEQMPFRRVMQTNQPVFGIEQVIQRPDGQRLVLGVNAAPLRDTAGMAAGMVAAFSDITGRKQVEGGIRRLNAELERRVTERTAELATANQELEAFSYSVSHDLQAPLRAIQGFGQVLREDYGQHLPAEGQEHLARVLTASQRMERLIHDLLELSRVTRAPLDRSTVDLSALALAVGLELQAAHTGRTVEFVVQPGMSAEADPGLMRIVLENLLGNAWKFTREAAAARIEFGVSQREGENAYQVRDNGSGFDMAYASRLFSPFQRLHSQHQFEGTGVGLATVQRIIRRHGGRVWAEGRVGQGATFFFTVPGG